MTHLILIEPPIFMEPWIVEVVEKQIKDLENPSENWAQELVDSILIKASDREREIALRALIKTSAFVKASVYKHLLTWDRKHDFECSIPTLLIQASKPFCREEKVGEIFSQLHVGRVVGSGPWVNLEVPLQLYSMIDRFLEVNTSCV